MATARLADIGAADPQPAILGGRGDHRRQQLAVGGLDRGALGERGARLADAGGEGIAHLLQPTEIEHPRRPGGGDPVRDVDPPEPLGDEAGQFELEPADLAP